MFVFEIKTLFVQIAVSVLELFSSSTQLLPFAFADRVRIDKKVETLQNDQHMLRLMVLSADTNAKRCKQGYRFDKLITKFACFVKMLAGLLAYETLHANLPLSLPSVSTVNRFMKDKGPTIVQGIPRIDELVKYLKDRNLPLRVSLSEDATRITPKIAYDSITNQLIGFALPLDENGMPLTSSFEANNAKQIQDHFMNANNSISSNVIVQMAQPQSRQVPAFCMNLYLTDNKYKAESVLSRWNHTIQESAQKGLRVDNYASDGDPRSLKVMKFKSQLGINDRSFLNCEWYSCGSSYETTYTQDSHHIGTKTRNRFTKPSRVTPIGSKIISVSHLHYLMENVSKDRHLLTPHTVNPKDRQNFLSVERICSPNVISCLKKYVPDSDGTAIFLKALHYSIYPFLDTSMNTADRVYKIWYAIFFYRGWRSWLSISKDYTLKESFISSNCYNCIEINGHTLVKQILKARDDPTYEFMPYKQGSQPCEGIFRQVRSMSSTFSTVVNCSMIDIIRRIRKIQFQSEIMHDCSETIKFPRLECKKTQDATTQSLPNKDDIIRIIEQAKSDLIRDMSRLDIDTSKLDFKCQVRPTNFHADFHYDDDIDTTDSDDDSGEEDEDGAEEDDCNDICNDDEAVIELEELEKDLREIAGLTGELMMRDYSTSNVKVDEKGPYALVVDSNGVEKVVRKSSICWLLSNDKYKLSSDRLQRVMESDYQSCGKTLFLTIVRVTHI